MKPAAHVFLRYGLTAAVLAAAATTGVRLTTQRGKGRETKMTKPKHTNRLIDSTSPYLLQHAHNPVDWYPWGSEALTRANREDKPIFLSIGYAACHWCHVMERESFENEEIARIMNEHFVCIKVDREERPDLDAIYMTAVQLMTGSGGWPMSIWLTPDLKPFYGGTYFPPESRWGRPGFKEVLLTLADAYENRRGDLLKGSKAVVAAMTKAVTTGETGAGPPPRDLIARAVSDLSRRFDSQRGGWGDAPKFPSASPLELLLRYHQRTGDASALHMATLTLNRMAQGGIYDHLGGGFHRYSVDADWLTPHFEKMLYDNAQLARVYLLAYQMTRAPLYRRVAQETLDFVLRDMTDPTGGFYSTLDADSEGEEGKFYTWTAAEIRRALGPADADLFFDYYGVTERGNFEGRNILHTPAPRERVAAKHGLTAAALAARLQPLRSKLLALRNNRVWPRKDDKVLADWNGLMISALAQAYQALGEERYRRAAQRAGAFVLAHMRDQKGRLLHVYRAGASHVDAYLDDYAFLAAGLLDLYEATFDVQWFDAAKGLVDEMNERFWDPRAGGFFLTEPDRPHVILRLKTPQDQAVPSGNAAAARTLLRLSRLTGQDTYARKAERTLTALARPAERDPEACTQLLLALDSYYDPGFEIAVVGGQDDKETGAMLSVVRRRSLPASVVAFLDPTWPNAARVAKRIPLLANRPPVDGKATAYVCRGFQCKVPVTTAADLEAQLK